jgi:flavin-binding protein dodecin
MGVRLVPDENGKLRVVGGEHSTSAGAARTSSIDLAAFATAVERAREDSLRVPDFFRQEEAGRLRAAATERFRVNFEIWVRLPVEEALPPVTNCAALPDRVTKDASLYLSGQDSHLNWLPLGNKFSEPITDLAGLGSAGKAELFSGLDGTGHLYGPAVMALGKRMVADGRWAAYGNLRGAANRLPPEWFDRMGGWRLVEACLPVVLIPVATAQRWARVPNGPDGIVPPESPTDCSDERFIAEGLKLISSGKCLNANQAAESLVRRYGVKATLEQAVSADCIVAASGKAAVDRLGRRMRKRLKEQPKP